MRLKHYQNEIIVGVAFLCMFLGYMYKEVQVDSYAKELRILQQDHDEIKEAIALKRVWNNPRLARDIDRLKQVVPESKVTWSQKSNQLNTTYKDISAEALNQITERVLNLGVQIQKFDIQQQGSLYKVELKCKW